MTSENNETIKEEPRSFSQINIIKSLNNFASNADLVYLDDDAKINFEKLDEQGICRGLSILFGISCYLNEQQHFIDQLNRVISGEANPLEYSQLIYIINQIQSPEKYRDKSLLANHNNLIKEQGYSSNDLSLINTLNTFEALIEENDLNLQATVSQQVRTYCLPMQKSFYPKVNNLNEIRSGILKQTLQKGMITTIDIKINQGVKGANDKYAFNHAIAIYRTDEENERYFYYDPSDKAGPQEFENIAEITTKIYADYNNIQDRPFCVTKIPLFQQTLEEFSQPVIPEKFSKENEKHFVATMFATHSITQINNWMKLPETTGEKINDIMKVVGFSFLNEAIAFEDPHLAKMLLDIDDFDLEYYDHSSTTGFPPFDIALITSPDIAKLLCETIASKYGSIDQYLTETCKSNKITMARKASIDNFIQEKHNPNDFVVQVIQDNITNIAEFVQSMINGNLWKENANIATIKSNDGYIVIDRRSEKTEVFTIGNVGITIDNSVAIAMPKVNEIAHQDALIDLFPQIKDFDKEQSEYLRRAFAAFLNKTTHKSNPVLLAANGFTQEGKDLLSIFSSIVNNDEEKLKTLFEKYPNTDKIWETLAIRNAINYAMSEKKFDVIELILTHGVSFDFSAVGILNETSHTSISPIHFLVYHAETNALTFLVEQNVDLNRPNDSGMTPLHLAIQSIDKENDYNKVVSILVQGGCDINKKDNQGKTALHYAISNGANNIAYLLLEGNNNIKANVNAVDNEGSTPLFAAIKNGNIELINALLKHGAKCDVATHKGSTPLMELFLSNEVSNLNDKITVLQNFLDNLRDNNLQDESKFNLLYLALLKKSDNRIFNLLIANQDLLKTSKINAEIFRDKKKTTILHLAAKKNNFELMKKLIDAGANIDQKDADGKLYHEYITNLSVQNDIIAHTGFVSSNSSNSTSDNSFTIISQKLGINKIEVKNVQEIQEAKVETNITKGNIYNSDIESNNQGQKNKDNEKQEGGTGEPNM